MDLERWNHQELWRFEYEDMSNGHLFFAEDIFGEQFSMCGGRIHSFDPETGSSEDIAGTIEEWCAAIIDDHAYLTGWSLAHDWQEARGPLPMGKRLLPATLFVLGGEYSVRNLSAVDSVEAMRFRGSIAKLIRHLPDGHQVRIQIVD
jgi:hypothetical protein